jgi:hypothetical protein
MEKCAQPLGHWPVHFSLDNVRSAWRSLRGIDRPRFPQDAPPRLRPARKTRAGPLRVSARGPVSAMQKIAASV